MSQPSPLAARAAAAGATFIEEAGWSLPAHFGDATAEYGRARERAAFFDLSHRGKIQAEGKDAAGFLHNLCTNDVKGLPPGQGCEAFFTTGQARIVGHGLIFCIAPQRYGIDVPPGQANKLIEHLEHYHITEDVNLVDVTAEYVHVHLAGPQAPAMLEQILSAELPEPGRLQLAERKLHSGAEVQVRRNDALGLPGFDLLCAAAKGEELWDALVHSGAQPAGTQAYHMLRVEAGTPIYGLDIDETNLPQEVNRTALAVSFDKGCYIGQETVARIRTYGHVNRSLVLVKLPAGAPVASGAKLWKDGKEVGRLTSFARSPRHACTIALAYVRRGCEMPDTKLQVEGIEAAAEVSALPLA